VVSECGQNRYFLLLSPAKTAQLSASGIIFIVLVQWSLVNRGASNHQLTFIFVASKAVIATIMWMWLLMDSIFYQASYNSGNRGKRIGVAAISIIVVLVLFYPSALYAAYARKVSITRNEEAPSRQTEHNITAEEENIPLLA
jgi:hypothetical protein